MRTVVLFNAGESGGLMITDSGVRPLLPFEQGTLEVLKSAAAMVKATKLTPSADVSHKTESLATRLANLAVEQVEDIVGPLDAEQALVFQADGGGFVCGSSGKPPVPLPWPAPVLPSVQELLAAGVIEPDLVEVVQRARQQGVPLEDIFENPAQAASAVGVALSEKGASDLRALAPTTVAELANDTDREIVRLFYAVAKDGRYVGTWFQRPYETARELQVDLSDAALERLAMGGGGALYGAAKPNGSYICAGIAWAGVCIAVGIVAAAAPGPVDELVVDRSGLQKL